VSFDLDLEHTLDAAGPSGTIMWKFCGDPVICLGEAICANVYRWTERRHMPHDGI